MARAKGKKGAGDAVVVLGAPRHRVRHDGWTGEKQRGFVEALAKAGNVRDACRVVGMSNTSAYRLRRIDPAFRGAWDMALTRASTSLEAVAYVRAVDGIDEVVIRDGKEHSRKRRYSDGLLRLLLQASNPEKYGRTGGMTPVKAREAVDARVKEIEQRSYRAAWRALVAEYNFRAEPHYLRLHYTREIAVMHSRICSNARCRECHPERVREGWSDIYDADADHQPIEAPARWIQEEVYDAMREERLRAADEGREAEFEMPGPFQHRPCRADERWLPPAPHWEGSAAEDEEE
jgi:hypothetical protein